MFVYQYILIKVDVECKIVIFVIVDGGSIEMGYDYFYVIFLQCVLEVICQFGLAWVDKWMDQGWVEVDFVILCYCCYLDIFVLGDVVGVFKGKIVVSVKWQVLVVEDQLVFVIIGSEVIECYDGYIFCLLIIWVGCVMLVEFDYYDNLMLFFFGLIVLLEEFWISWLMKEVVFKVIYNVMLCGKV